MRRCSRPATRDGCQVSALTPTWRPLFLRVYYQRNRLSNGVLPWVKIVRMKIWAKLLLLPLILSGVWGSHVLVFLWSLVLLQDPAFLGIFVHLCEAFLGIEPHFELFRFLFHLKPQPDTYDLDVVDGAGLQLRQGKDKGYIPYKLSSKVIDWKPK